MEGIQCVLCFFCCVALPLQTMLPTILSFSLQRSHSFLLPVMRLASQDSEKLEPLTHRKRNLKLPGWRYWHKNVNLEANDINIVKCRHRGTSFSVTAVCDFNYFYIYLFIKIFSSQNCFIEQARMHWQICSCCYWKIFSLFMYFCI